MVDHSATIHLESLPGQKPIVTRRELEVSIGWWKNHTAEAGKQMLDFAVQAIEEGMSITVDNSRNGFVTYIASLPEKAHG